MIRHRDALWEVKDSKRRLRRERRISDEPGILLRRIARTPLQKQIETWLLALDLGFGSIRLLRNELETT